MEFKLPPGAFMGGHCGVQAVAVAAGISLTEAFRVFQENIPRTRRRRTWGGGTFHSERVKVLNKLGVKFEELNPAYTKGLTLQRFIKDVANPNHVYMVTTTHHVQMVRGGQVLDQRGANDIAEFWGRRKKISFPVLRIDVAEVAEAFDIAEAQTFGLPLFDYQEENK